MPTQYSLDIWADAWRRTAAEYRIFGAQEAGYAKCRNLPARIRRQSAAAAVKAEKDAAECEVYALTGVRY
jgi:hypothetical protein